VTAAAELAMVAGVAAACATLAVVRATYYRRRAPARPPKPRPTPARALSEAERTGVLAVLNAEDFADLAPREIWGRLIDDGRYLCSVSTMYRLLAQAGAVRERRDLLRHPTYTKPELVATAPNQVWTWDITKLRGPVPGVHYCLYVVLDLYSRYAVAWMVAPTENGTLASELLEQACAKQGIVAGDLTVHNDRGSPMKSWTFAQKLADLGVAHSFSRPHVSNDNSRSEAQFKTLKYAPGYPDRFGSIEDARAYCRSFFVWYNDQHRHTGLNLHTPADVHHGRAAAVTEARQRTLTGAYAANPERFVRKPPLAAGPPPAAWINPPKPPASEEALQ